MEKNTRITLSGIYCASYLALIALSGIIDPNMSLINKALIYLILFIPFSGFFLYLIFVPLIYKSQRENVFGREFYRWEISTERIQSFYDWGAEILPSSLVTMGLELLTNNVTTSVTTHITNPATKGVVNILVVISFTPVIYLIHKMLGIKLRKKGEKIS